MVFQIVNLIFQIWFYVICHNLKDYTTANIMLLALIRSGNLIQNVSLTPIPCFAKVCASKPIYVSIYIYMDGHSRHVATTPLWWWGGWAHWIVFMTSIYMYYALCFVHVEHSVCHEPISVLINIYIHIYTKRIKLKTCF